MIDIGAVVAGHFKVLKKLGEGGMGAVFEVENTNNGRHFALKTVHPHLMQSSAALARFADEVRASVMVESDHVVNAVDTGVDEITKTPWLLLELLQGQTLEDEIKARGALAPSEARWILEQLGAALVAAHTAQPQVVVHLDLKPSNVFLANTRTVSRARMVKVLDFGLARFIDASKTAADLTSKSGTLEWMAPEQFEVGQVRPAADVWAYGLIAYFVLTGRCFWKSANVSSSQYKSAAVLAEVIGRPIPIATARLKELAVDVSLPQGFDAWLKGCLQREEGDRFKSAVECVPALLALLPESGASVAPPTKPVPVRGATAVGVPSIPKDLPPPEVLPPVETPKRPSVPPVQRTELMGGGAPTSEPGPTRWETPVAPTRSVLKRLVAVVAVPLLGLAVWGLTRPRSLSIPGDSGMQAVVATAPAEPVAHPPPPEAARVLAAATPAAEPTRAEVPAAPAVAAPTRSHHTREERSSRTTARAVAPAPAPAPPPPPPEPAAPAALAAQAVPTRRAAAAPLATTASGQELPERPSRLQITSVMGGLNSAVRDCVQGQTGTAPVAVVIANDGSVRSASVSGEFAGSPSGQCIERVVLRAQFSPFRASESRVTWPFVILPPR